MWNKQFECHKTQSQSIILETNEYSLAICHCPVSERRIHGRHKHGVYHVDVFSWCRSEHPEKPIFSENNLKTVQKAWCCPLNVLFLWHCLWLHGSWDVRRWNRFFLLQIPFLSLCTNKKDKKTQNYTGSFYFIPFFCYTVVWNWNVGPVLKDFVIALFVVTQSV